MKIHTPLAQKYSKFFVLNFPFPSYVHHLSTLLNLVLVSSIPGGLRSPFNLPSSQEHTLCLQHGQ